MGLKSPEFVITKLIWKMMVMMIGKKWGSELVTNRKRVNFLSDISIHLQKAGGADQLEDYKG